jgi:RNA polymerase sigma-70 factor (ECF subfamily)
VASDEEIIDAVVRGDDRVADLLYDRTVAVIDRTLLRVLGRRESDHDDLVQATFEQIVLTLVRQRFARACSLATWAARVASHIGLNALRSRRRERRVIGRDDPDAGDGDLAPAPVSFEQELAARSDFARIREHLAAMDPAKAETLFLHDVLGHELAEVALLTGATVAAAQSRLVRGRRELLDRLDEDVREGRGEAR